MKCLANKDHRGVNMRKLRNGTDEQYATLVCSECSAWIRYLSKAEYDSFVSLDPERAEETEEEAVEKAEADVVRMERCINKAVSLERDCFINTRPHGDPFLILQIAFKLFDAGR